MKWPLCTYKLGMSLTEPTWFIHRRFKYRMTRPVTPREVEHVRKCQEQSLAWTKPLLAYQEKKKSKEENGPKEPHMIHVVTRVKTLFGRPWWEKEICEEFGLDDQMHKAVPLKNVPSVNKKLKEIKHLVQIQPLEFPHGLPEHESDFEHTVLRSDGKLIVKKKIDAYETSKTEQEPDPVTLRNQLSIDTIQKHCDNIKQRYEIHKEYFKTEYIYKHNQDGKEYRYTKFPYATKED